MKTGGSPIRKASIMGEGIISNKKTDGSRSFCSKAGALVVYCLHETYNFLYVFHFV